MGEEEEEEKREPRGNSVKAESLSHFFVGRLLRMARGFVFLWEGMRMGRASGGKR